MTFEVLFPADVTAVSPPLLLLIIEVIQQVRGINTVL